MRFSFLALVCALTASMAVSTQADTNAKCSEKNEYCDLTQHCCQGYSCIIAFDQRSPTPILQCDLAPSTTKGVVAVIKPEA
ncbi:uncharacterized protein EDB93DRAFT_1167423, partial [Suillus bovinus]|uniref:uncharacterized protein n=1 Tax=Suillus bovinus TaxID=48563 RepID=UPI001B86AFA6